MGRRARKKRRGRGKRKRSFWGRLWRSVVRSTIVGGIVNDISAAFSDTGKGWFD